MSPTQTTLTAEQALRRELEGTGSPDTFKKNYLVEAGAGAGKSTTMVRRIASVLLSGHCKPDQLVVITFTKKATQELVGKLDDTFAKLLQHNTSDLSREALEKLASDVTHMQVSTIDSFCRTVLETMPFANPLGMGSEMVDDRQIGQEYFLRRCREDDSLFAVPRDRFGISYNAFASTFLGCCSHTSALLSFVPTKAPPMASLEADLKTTAQAVYDQLNALRQQEYPQFASLLSEEMKALLDAPLDNADTLAAYLLSCKQDKLTYTKNDAPKHNPIHAEAYLEYEDCVKRFKAQVKNEKDGGIFPKVGKRTPLDSARAQAFYDAVEALLAEDSRYPAFLNLGLYGLIKGWQHAKGTAAEPAALDALNLWMIENTAKLGPRYAPAITEYKQFAERMDAIIWPSKPLSDGADSSGKATGAGNAGNAKESVVEADNSICNLTRRLIHAHVMETVSALVQDYQQEKLARHQATFGDVMLYTRNMLRENAAVRNYFHDRYRLFFVDEFQDTDATQAEIFFSITSAPEKFDPLHWENCHPEPGSLFLVGDPKQAIYRFRGADIDTYNLVCKCFRDNGVGELVKLAYNFRSTKEICDYTRAVFSTLLGSSDPYQAPYAPMLAVQPGSEPIALREDCPLSYVLTYAAEGKDSDEKRSKDAARVAAFIRHMVEDEVPVYAGGNLRPARYSDFLVLPYAKRYVNSYATEFRRWRIPTNISGEHHFGNTASIARVVCYLRFLLEHSDPLLLTQVLHRCYGISYSCLRRLGQRGQIPNLTAVFYRETQPDGSRVSKLERFTAALQAEKTPDKELLAACGALQEIGRFLSATAEVPAMTLIEQLFDGACIGGEAEDLTTRQADYGRVQQFLELLRSEGKRDFRSLAQRAVECAEEAVENELSLTEAEDCVRIMNLHKSKGLEGEIVILPYAWKKSGSPIEHLEHAGGATVLHRCVTQEYDGSEYPVAWNLDWENEKGTGKKPIELAYLDAEQLRLLYVAATRAKSLLLINVDNKTSRWLPLTEADAAPLFCKTDEEAEQDALKAKYGDKMYTALNALVMDESCTQTDEKTQDAAASEPTVTEIQADVMEDALRACAAALQESTRYAITPSGLDHASRTSRRRDERVDGDSAADDSTAVDSAVTPRQPDVMPPSQPYGPDWGTILHRIMELAVGHRAFDEAALQSFAAQAVSETLADVPLSKTQRRRLLYDETKSDEQNRLGIVKAATEAAAFLSAEDAPLRTLIQDAACYPELPFFLWAEERSDQLYRHLSDHIRAEEAKGKSLEVQGVIDLAVYRNGVWSIVDYKTDIRRPGESDDLLRQRLREEYTPQIAAYARVLERLGKGRVDSIYLCSIPLRGELISLPDQQAH